MAPLPEASVGPGQTGIVLEKVGLHSKDLLYGDVQHIRELSSHLCRFDQK